MGVSFFIWYASGPEIPPKPSISEADGEFFDNASHRWKYTVAVNNGVNHIQRKGFYKLRGFKEILDDVPITVMKTVSCHS